MEIVVYTRNFCGYCVKAKALLNKYNLDYQEVSLDSEDTITKFKLKYPEAKTVPQIIIDGVRIGGYTELLSSEVIEDAKQNQ